MKDVTVKKRAPRIVPLFSFLFLFFLFCTPAQAQHQAQDNTTPIANQINATADYLALVNESGYTIFYPNLTNAYSLLSQAQNISSNDPTRSSELLSSARQSAQQQLSAIDSYKAVAATVIIIMTVVSAAVLYYVMLPYQKNKRKNSKPKL